MQRINTPTKAANLFGPGKDGFRAAGQAGERPTQLSPDFLNDVQEEIANLIEGAGLALGASNAQMLQALGVLINNAVQVATNPTGKLSYFADTAAPAGWVVLDGNTIGEASSGATARGHADTQALFVHIWNKFPDRPLFESNGNPTSRGASALADFNAHKRLQLWDDRGEFWRGADLGRGVAPGQDVGEWVDGSVGPHTHSYQKFNAGSGDEYVGNYDANGGQRYNAATATASNSGNETRPRNRAWLPCIKL